VLEIDFIQFVNGHNTDEGEPPWLIVIFFFLGVVDDDKPPWLIVIYLFFLLGVVDDGKPGGLSSFLSFFLRCRRRRQASWLIIVFWFFSSNGEDDGELGGSRLIVISWIVFHWLHHHLMHHYSTFLYVGMSPPSDKCKGKEEKNSEVYSIWTCSWPKGTTLVMLVGVSCVCWKFILFNL
jgi:hypothetical protein